MAGGVPGRPWILATLSGGLAVGAGAAAGEVVYGIVAAPLVALTASAFEVQRRRVANRRFADDVVALFWQRLLAELERSRRHGHPVTLVRLELERPPRTGERQRLQQELERALRIGDAACVDGQHVFLFLAETPASAAGAAVARVVAGLQAPVRATATATFPDHGLTSHALVTALDTARLPGVTPAPERELGEPPRLRLADGA